MNLKKLAAVGCIALASLGAGAQEWPRQSVKLLVGSSPGGGTDAMARAVADRLGPLLGQSVRGAIAPLGVAVIIGAFMFGVGMQLGGG